MTGAAVQQRAEGAEQTQTSSEPGGVLPWTRTGHPDRMYGAEKQRQWTEARQSLPERLDGEWDIDEGRSRLSAEAGGSMKVQSSEDRPMGPAAAVGCRGKQETEPLGRGNLLG